MQRIADALQVSPAVLHASDIVPALSGDGTLDGDLDRECVALLRAYTRIADPEERRRLLAIVQAAAAPA